MSTTVVIALGGAALLKRGDPLEAGVQLIAPECAIPLRTKLENLLEIPAAVKDWAGERMGN